jgi:hypothetical protein
VFLEFANFYKQFIQYYTKITRTLTKLLKDNKQEKQNKSFVFNKNIVVAFKKFIFAFTRTSILVHVHFNLKNYIYVKTNILEFVIVVIFS